MTPEVFALWCYIILWILIGMIVCMAIIFIIALIITLIIKKGDRDEGSK